MATALCFVLSLLISVPWVESSPSEGYGGGRHSYSLTTFDPNGNLDQVARATLASASHSAPVAALAIGSETRSVDGVGDGTSPSWSGGIYAAAPLLNGAVGAASSLIRDDGTPRCVSVTSSICILHAGVVADGRVLCDTAAKMAVDHAYLYDEEMPLEVLLEGLSSAVQECTARPGTRPYGCALLVCRIDGDGCSGVDNIAVAPPSMYRIDPSGAVEMVSNADILRLSMKRRRNLSLTSSVTSSGGDAVSVDRTDRKDSQEGRRGSAAFMGNWNDRSLGQTSDGGGSGGSYPKISASAIMERLDTRRFRDEEEVKLALVDAVRTRFHRPKREGAVSAIDNDNDDVIAGPDERRRVSVERPQPVLFISFTKERGLQISRVLS